MASLLQKKRKSEAAADQSMDIDGVDDAESSTKKDKKVF